MSEPLQGVAAILPGTEVEIWGGVRAKVIAVMVDDAMSVSYRLAYWNHEGLMQEWVAASLVQAACELRLGFHNGKA